MNRNALRRIFGLVAGVLLGVIGGISCTEAAGDEKIQGHWIYASGESEGSTASVSGDLKIAAAGTFEDNRRIGGIGGFRKGSYRVSGDAVTLTYNGGSSAQTYRFSFGSAVDSDGKPVETLLLRGTGLSFLLTRKAG